MTLHQLEQMPADELPLWAAFDRQHGLPGTRLEASIAIGSACIAQSMGAKVKASDLVPRFDSPAERRRILREQLRKWATDHNNARLRREATT